MSNRTLLLLFDVDGTLVDSAGSGSRSVRKAVEALHGDASVFDRVQFAGRTDMVIVSDALRLLGVEPLPERLEEVRLLYLAKLASELEAAGDRAKALPGVTDLLARLHVDPCFQTGILTGNWSDGARMKLSHCGIWHFFPFGAFGEDGPERERLVGPALERAGAWSGRSFRHEEVWVIGDTPLDVRCGIENGTRTLAVATGPYTRSQLERAGADIVIDAIDTATDLEAMLLDFH
ncbi:HAD hydrolase-like protein [Candidatus Fermentibacterales bacterium]|nr:HAD hydrolase-like protein [Candidatus Fermentibacterales bacterium]